MSGTHIKDFRRGPRAQGPQPQALFGAAPHLNPKMPTRVRSRIPTQILPSVCQPQAQFGGCTHVAPRDAPEPQLLRLQQNRCFVLQTCLLLSWLLASCPHARTQSQGSNKRAATAWHFAADFHSENGDAELFNEANEML